MQRGFSIGLDLGFGRFEPVQMSPACRYESPPHAYAGTIARRPASMHHIFGRSGIPTAERSTNINRPLDSHLTSHTTHREFQFLNHATSESTEQHFLIQQRSLSSFHRRSMPDSWVLQPPRGPWATFDNGVSNTNCANPAARKCNQPLPFNVRLLWISSMLTLCPDRGGPTRGPVNSHWYTCTQCHPG